MALAVPPGSKIGQFIDTSYWAARLKDGSWHSEIDGKTWIDFLMSVGNTRLINQLWIFGAKVSEHEPQGQSAYLESLPNTEFFQEKGEHVHIIGRKDERAGKWDLFIWDSRTQDIRPDTVNWSRDAQ